LPDSPLQWTVASAPPPIFFELSFFFLLFFPAKRSIFSTPLREHVCSLLELLIFSPLFSRCFVISVDFRNLCAITWPPRFHYFFSRFCAPPSQFDDHKFFAPPDCSPVLQAGDLLFFFCLFRGFFSFCRSSAFPFSPSGRWLLVPSGPFLS